MLKYIQNDSYIPSFSTYATVQWTEVVTCFINFCYYYIWVHFNDWFNCFLKLPRVYTRSLSFADWLHELIGTRNQSDFIKLKNNQGADITKCFMKVKGDLN